MAVFIGFSFATLLCCYVGYWIITTPKRKLKKALESFGFKEQQQKYSVLYPSLGISIKSNSLTNAPLSLHRWKLDYTLIDKVSIVAHGFWGYKWSIEIDLAKTNLLDAGKFEIHQYLVKHSIIIHNDNLY